MTEQEWLACCDPGLMVNSPLAQNSDRKHRLFACACCRLAWNWMAEGQAMVAAAERHADGLATTDELEAAHPGPEIPAHVLGNLKLVLDGLLDEDAINTAGGTVCHLIGWAEERERQRVRNQ